MPSLVIMVVVVPILVRGCEVRLGGVCLFDLFLV